ncbi:MAG: hypothetical protein OXI18_04905 [bacterium]|nr:hypothetical protein [bacterium]
MTSRGRFCFAILIRAYQRNLSLWDFVIPLVVGGAALLVFWWVEGSSGVMDVVDGNRAAIYGTTASMATALLGFTITLVPILYALVSVEALRRVRESGYAPGLFVAAFHALVTLSVVVAATVAAMLFDRDESPQVGLQCVVFIVSCVAAWKLFTAIRLMKKTLNVALLSYRAEP